MTEPDTAVEAARYRLLPDALTPAAWAALAAMAMERFDLRFSLVRGVPRGGLPFARALERYAHPLWARTLIVDDVLTTGGSLARVRAQFPNDPLALVTFVRGPVPDDVMALWTLAPARSEV